jgi:hypothetical protein
MIHAPADPAADFKRCCMLGGQYDGSDRHYFFQASLRSALACLSLACASCAVIDHDVTNEPVAANLSGKCFVTQKALFIVHNGGIQIGARDELSIRSGADACEAPHGHDFFCRVQPKGDVPAGTEIMVTKVTDKAMGDNGRCWSVQGRFKDGQPGQGDFKIPSCGFDSISGTWLNEWQPAATHMTGEKLFFKTDALKPCDSPAPQ